MHASPLRRNSNRKALQPISSLISLSTPSHVDMASSSSFLAVVVALTMAAALLGGNECHAARPLGSASVKDDLPVPLPPLPEVPGVPLPPLPDVPLPPLPEVPGVPLPPVGDVPKLLPPLPEVPGVPLPPLPSAVP